MTTQATLISKDGTTIAYETSGCGPALIVISTVAEDRTGVAGIAGLLAEHFTVVNFDRRGRGGSGDPQPYDPARKVEDIEAGQSKARKYWYRPRHFPPSWEGTEIWKRRR